MFLCHLVFLLLVSDNKFYILSIYFNFHIYLKYILIFLKFLGDLFTGINYALTNPHAFYLMSIYTFLAYIAISFHMTLVKEYGSIVAVLVGNTRKVLTILLSFILFPKPFSFMYVIGIVLVFGSLIMHTILKENRKKENVKN